MLDRDEGRDRRLDQISIECRDSRLAKEALPAVKKLLEGLRNQYREGWNKIIVDTGKRNQAFVRDGTLFITINQIGDLNKLVRPKAAPQQSQHEHYLSLVQVLEPVVRRFLNLGSRSGVPSDLARSVLKVLEGLEASKSEEFVKAVSILDKKDREERRAPDVRKHYDAARAVPVTNDLTDRQGRQLVRLAEALTREFEAPVSFIRLTTPKAAISQRIAWLKEGVTFDRLESDAETIFSELKDLAAIIQCLPANRHEREMREFSSSYLDIRRLSLRICETTLVGEISTGQFQRSASVIQYLSDNFKRMDSVGLTDLLRRSDCQDDGWQLKRTLLSELVKQSRQDDLTIRSEEEALKRIASVLPDLVTSLGDFEREAPRLPNSIINYRQELLDLIRSTGGVQGQIFRGLFAKILPQMSAEDVYLELVLLDRNRRQAGKAGAENLASLKREQREIFRQAAVGIADVLLSDLDRDYLSRWADLSLEEEREVVDKMQAIVGQLLRPEMRLESRSEVLQGEIAVRCFLFAVDQTIEAIGRGDSYDNIPLIVEPANKAQTLAKFLKVNMSDECRQHKLALETHLQSFMDSLTIKFDSLINGAEVLPAAAVLAKMQAISGLEFCVESSQRIVAGIQEFQKVYKDYVDSLGLGDPNTGEEVPDANVEEVRNAPALIRGVLIELYTVEHFLRLNGYWTEPWQQMLNHFEGLNKTLSGRRGIADLRS